MTERKNKKIVMRLIDEVWNLGRLEVIAELCAPHARLVVPGDKHVGRDAFRDMVDEYRAAFPDLQVTVQQLFADADDVVVRWSALGTHRGALGGAQPSGNRVRLEGMTRNRLDGGLVIEQDYYWDQLSLLQQIGAVPEQIRAA